MRTVVRKTCHPATVRRPCRFVQEDAARRERAQSCPRSSRIASWSTAVHKDSATARRQRLGRIGVRKKAASLSARLDDAECRLDLGQRVEEDETRWPVDRGSRCSESERRTKEEGDGSDPHTTTMKPRREGAARRTVKSPRLGICRRSVAAPRARAARWPGATIARRAEVARRAGRRSPRCERVVGVGEREHPDESSSAPGPSGRAA